MGSGLGGLMHESVLWVARSARPGIELLDIPGTGL